MALLDLVFVNDYFKFLFAVSPFAVNKNAPTPRRLVEVYGHFVTAKRAFYFDFVFHLKINYIES